MRKRVTLPPPTTATHAARLSAAIQLVPRTGRRMRAETEFVSGSIRDTDPDRLDTQTDPAPTVTISGSDATSIAACFAKAGDSSDVVSEVMLLPAPVERAAVVASTESSPEPEHAPAANPAPITTAARSNGAGRRE